MRFRIASVAGEAGESAGSWLCVCLGAVTGLGCAGSVEKHFDEPNCWHQIKFEPLYDNLRDEPRYKALVKRAGLDR